LFSSSYADVNQRIVDIEKENKMVRTLNDLLIEKYGIEKEK
jgi:hypothetical protein